MLEDTSGLYEELLRGFLNNVLSNSRKVIHGRPEKYNITILQYKQHKDLTEPSNLSYAR